MHFPQVNRRLTALFFAAVSLAVQAHEFKPEMMADDTEMTNPMRGFYTWLHKNVAPQPTPAQDSYQRFSWAQLEKVQDQYNFSMIDRELDQLPKGGKFGFRIFALNGDFSWMNGIDVPAYLVEHPAKGFFLPANPKNTSYPKSFVPDWNDPFFLERAELLLTALGNKYDGDPRIAWVDIGMYGNWAEWHTSGLSNFPRGRIPYADTALNPQGAEPGTLETRKRIVDAHAKAFKKTRLIMMTDDKVALAYALRLPTSIPVGIRRDSWGDSHFSQDLLSSDMPAADQELVTNRWKVAPFIVESFGGAGAFNVGAQGLVDQVENFHVSLVGNGGFASQWEPLSPENQQGVLKAGRRSGYRFAITAVKLPDSVPAGSRVPLQTHWINHGVAPAYESWRVEFLLTKPGQTKPVTMVSTVSLGKMLPSKEGEMVNDILAIPADLPPGRYDLTVTVIDPESYRLPMQLAIQGRTESGSYTLGSVEVGGLMKKAAEAKPNPADLQTWTNKEGKGFKASQLRVEGDNVVLKREDGQVFLVPIAKLSLESQAQVKH
jgi:hypothetical protein